MRSFGKKQIEEETEIDITPMLDVVFIMLIFFIVTASFVKEAGIDVLKPEANSAFAKPEANIFVAIDDKDNVWIAGEKVPIENVGASIKKLRAENPVGTVIIQADKESTNNMLMQVLDSAKKNDAGNVAISTET